VKCALIHGFAGSPAAWDDVIAAWALPEPPLALALPGHGGGMVRATWDENLAAIAQAMAGCDVAVGYSLGARVALGLVVSGRVPHAVLIGLNPGVADADREERRAADLEWARRARTQGSDEFFAAWEGQPLFATQARVPAGRRAARRERRRLLDRDQLAQSLEHMGLAAMPDYWSAVPAHRDRIALIAGADDAKYVAISQGLPAAFFETIPDSGHDPTLEQPAALARAIGRAVIALR
jgi:2-succinyl-6-hydroxy-2,4-cyclohexadiene-1-carboxylate synthase